ncbi:MAG: SCO family protein [Bacteroidota bacterium]
MKLKVTNILFLSLALIAIGAINWEMMPSPKGGLKGEKQSWVEHLPYYNEATFTPHWLLPNDQVLDTFHRISSFELINQEGKTITERTFEGKIYVANFFFTICPGICRKMTNNMSILQGEFMEDEEIQLLSHSVTPEMDSVPVLKQYAEVKGVISDKWHLVTGSQSEIYRLGRRDYFVEEDLGLQRNENEFLHTENFVLIDKQKHIRGIYNGLNKSSVRQLIADIKTLKKEYSLLASRP